MTDYLDNISIYNLLVTLGVLLIASGFFSATETAMMALNRYKLKHLAKHNNTAKRVYKLISKPDKLLAVILICNNLVNIYAATIATIIGAKLFGNTGATIYAPITLTVVLLIFGEITPKTLAATHPQGVAFLASLPIKILHILMFPFIKLVNTISNLILRIFGVKKIGIKNDALSLEELHTVVSDDASVIPEKHKEMLSSMLVLNKMTVNDIMVPRLEVIGIDLNDDAQNNLKTLKSTQHTLLPVYRDELNQADGILHMREAASLCISNKLELENIQEHLQEPYYVPEGTSLYIQLINFQRNKRRMALVVDEYGDVQGLITIADILEEIVGQFTTDISDLDQEIFPQKDGTLLIDGSISIRVLNERMSFNLPATGAKTLSGLIIEHLEFIPEQNTCVNVGKYFMEIMQIQDNMIKTVKFYNK